MSNPRRRKRTVSSALLLGLASTVSYATLPIGAAAQGPPQVPPGQLPDPSPSNEDRIGTDLVPKFPNETPGTSLDLTSPFYPPALPLADPAQVKAIETGFLDSIRAIPDPSNRALAYDQVIRAFLTTDDWESAERALVEGGRTAAQIGSPELRDLRSIGLVAAAVALNEELIQESTIDETSPYISQFFGPIDEGSKPSRAELLDRARRVAEHAGSIANLIRNVDFRSSALADLAESIADGAGKVYIAQAVPTDAGPESESDRVRNGAVALLTSAERIAEAIPLRVWRYQTLLRVTNAASNAGMFSAAAPIARRIESPEARVDALIRLAESQSRGNEPDLATQSYQDAFAAVLAIPREGVRNTLCKVLIFSLVSAGRFEDARVATRYGLSQDLVMESLGEIARSMGERGRIEAANRWINGEPDPGLRSRLLRELNDGLVLWVQRNRPNPTGVYNGGGLLGTPPS